MDIFNKRGTPIPPPEIPVHKTADPYLFGSKVEGYPMGQPSAFVDGRLLKNCIFGTAWAHHGPFGVPPFANAFQLNVRNTGNDRALYIKQIHLMPFYNATDDIQLNWLILADNKFIWGGDYAICCAETPKKTYGLYFPPRTNVDIYLQFNAGATAPAVATYVADIAVEWIEFDALSDIWKWGSGERKVNPPAAIIAALGRWP